MNTKPSQLRTQPPQFISKLHKMIQEFPHLINFSNDGTELIIPNKHLFINTVLIEYFRHSNWRSFIRQLNMYNFRKINRGMQQEIFINPLFQKGNQDNYHKIKRKINTREQTQFYQKQLYKQTQFSLYNLTGCYSSLSFFMNDIFNFKVKADEIIHDLKNDVEEFGAKKKTKDIKPMIQEIKESFQMIDEGSQKIINSLQNFSKLQDLHHESLIPNNKQSNEFVSFFSSSSLQLLNDSEKQKVEDLEQKRKKSCQILGVSIKSSFSEVTSLVN